MNKNTYLSNSTHSSPHIVQNVLSALAFFLWLGYILLFFEKKKSFSSSIQEHFLLLPRQQRAVIDFFLYIHIKSDVDQTISFFYNRQFSGGIEKILLPPFPTSPSNQKSNQKSKIQPPDPRGVNINLIFVFFLSSPSPSPSPSSWSTTNFAPESKTCST